MKEKPLFLLVVFFYVAVVFIGNRIAVQGINLPQHEPHEIARATVQRVVDRTLPDIYLDAFDDPAETLDLLAMLGERLVFEARINAGPRRGQVIVAEQSLGSFWGVVPREVAQGDRILLINNNMGWFFDGHLLSTRLIVLGVLLVVFILLLGGRKGVNTIIALGLTLGGVFGVFIPSILAGWNIYLMALFVCVFTTIVTLTLVIGFNQKSLVAGIGCLGGILVTVIITVIMDRLLFLTGMTDEHSRFLATLPIDHSINLRAIVFAGIIIGAMGAIMDVAMSIASSLWEVKEKARYITFDSLFRSGINIGRDMMGSMANTLILAYIGTSLALVLVLSVYTNSLMELFNIEMIAVEVLQAVAGSFGIIFSMPITAFACAAIFSNEWERR
ncbi:MAG: YibE/F family protein [Spirochaetes bacterium]|nr:YibE/F family protein [Spirochaetota bacterium]